MKSITMIRPPHNEHELESNRAHDLIDLQIIMQREELYLPCIKRICKQIFRGPKCPVWPPKIVKNADWDTIYNEQKLDLPVLKTVDEAIVWANELIARIDAAE